MANCSEAKKENSLMLMISWSLLRDSSTKAALLAIPNFSAADVKPQCYYQENYHLKSSQGSRFDHLHKGHSCLKSKGLVFLPLAAFKLYLAILLGIDYGL